MAKFPEWTDIQFDFPMDIEFETKTLMSNFDGMGKEKRRRKFLFPRRNVKLTYSDRFLTRAQVRTLWQFYLDRGGAYEAFSFFVTAPPASAAASGLNTFEGEYIGVGDGVTTDFTLPGRSVQNELVYHDNVEYIPSDYTIIPTGGADGADKITFVAAPAAGLVLTIDFTGVLRLRCRFMEDNLSYQDFYNIVARTGLELKGLLNDE